MNTDMFPEEELVVTLREATALLGQAGEPNVAQVFLAWGRSLEAGVPRGELSGLARYVYRALRWDRGRLKQRYLVGVNGRVDRESSARLQELLAQLERWSKTLLTRQERAQLERDPLRGSADEHPPRWPARAPAQRDFGGTP